MPPGTTEAVPVTAYRKLGPGGHEQLQMRLVMAFGSTSMVSPVRTRVGAHMLEHTHASIRTHSYAVAEAEA